ncbi:SGNH hydrolase [Mycena maculata]|uniref:SGNH hydrolase n=1 Tax=Mycena maculata TaxID=230809 RepID=A0AAD7IA64_9AGAR|nr:SGNH hydrolase [Mycena maculata]
MAANVQDAIMLFGDSLTQAGWEEGGFGARLQHVYSRKLDVLNRGFSGYNTEWAIPVLEQCLANQYDQQHVPKIRLLVVWFGANDACIGPSPQHVPLPKFIENLKHIIILITPPPVNTYQRAADLNGRDPSLALDRMFETTKEYAEGVKAAAAASKVSVVDVWTAIWKAAGEREEGLSKYLWDGLHINADGYMVVYEALIETIKVKHHSLHYENLQPVFPPFVAFFLLSSLVDFLDRWTQVNQVK